MTYIGKVFQNGKSQAIRIPKACRVDSDEVFIEKEGDILIIRPRPRNGWARFFEAAKKVDTSDFLSDREQPALQERELF